MKMMTPLEHGHGLQRPFWYENDEFKARKPAFLAVVINKIKVLYRSDPCGSPCGSLWHM
jgi:hypothetical protein